MTTGGVMYDAVIDTLCSNATFHQAKMEEDDARAD